LRIPGHISTAWLVAVVYARRRGRLPDLPTEVIPAVLGALTPDLIDKPLLYAGVFRHGRSIGHSLVFLLAGAALFLVVRRTGSRWAVPLGMWVLGIASHFAADLADDLVSGFLSGGIVISSWFGWPLTTPSTWDWRSGTALWPGYPLMTPLEYAVIGLAVWTAFRLRES